MLGSTTLGDRRPFAPRSHKPLAVRLAEFAFFTASVLVVAVVAFKIGVMHRFNVNEGWNGFWAAAAWSGGELYPDPASLKLNNYLPFWSYATGALGSLTGDNIQAGRILAGLALV